jgi:metal-responsive CopG/Arc/MetJ family transcriptional regulator
MQGQLTIRLTDDIGKGLDAVARRRGCKRSELVRQALENYLKEELVAEEITPYDRVQSLLGSVETGTDDLGENHHDHLSQRFRRDE